MVDFNLNFDIKLLRRLVTAVERLCDDYHDLHAAELEAIRVELPAYEPKVFYQDDKRAVEDELREQLEAAAKEMVNG